MKDFCEFEQFMLEDCLHEFNAIGEEIVERFSDDELRRIGLSPDALGMLLKVCSFQTSKFVMLALRRYHEWNETFPE